jgi:hypothetical protein
MNFGHRMLRTTSKLQVNIELRSDPLHNWLAFNHLKAQSPDELSFAKHQM